jgi:hypothetical protein
LDGKCRCRRCPATRRGRHPRSRVAVGSLCAWRAGWPTRSSTTGWRRRRRPGGVCRPAAPRHHLRSQPWPHPKLFARIVPNRAIDGRRGRATHREIGNIDGREVRNLLDDLPAGQRETLELAYFGAYTHVEIAKQMGVPLGTVKGRLRMGLRKRIPNAGISERHSGAPAVTSLFLLVSRDILTPDAERRR